MSGKINVFIIVWSVIWWPIIGFLSLLIAESPTLWASILLLFSVAIYLYIYFLLLLNKNKLSNADELEKYAELRNKGIITEEEFASKKKKLLDL